MVKKTKKNNDGMGYYVEMSLEKKMGWVAAKRRERKKKKNNNKMM